MEIKDSGHLEFDKAIDTRSIRKLRIDLEWVDHVNIYGLVGMAASVMHAAKEGHEITIIPPQHSASACAFISRLGFDRFVRDVGNVPCDLSVTSEQRDSDVLVELQTIDTDGDLLPLQDLLLNRLDGVAGPQAKNAIVEAVWELGANVNEHSESTGILGAVVQRGGKKRRSHLDFAIFDVGKGLRQSFLDGKAGHHPSSDHEAISLALEYLVSSVDDPGRGQGLATVAEEAAGLNGRVVIRSGNSRRHVVADRRDGMFRLREFSASVPRFPGTGVAVSVPCR